MLRCTCAHFATRRYQSIAAIGSKRYDFVYMGSIGKQSAARILAC